MAHTRSGAKILPPQSPDTPKPGVSALSEQTLCCQPKSVNSMAYVSVSLSKHQDHNKSQSVVAVSWYKRLTYGAPRTLKQKSWPPIVRLTIPILAF